MGILLAISSALLIGTANFFMKKSYKDFTPAVALFFFTIFTIIFWTITGIGYGIDSNNLLKAFGLGLISAVFAQGIYIYILSKGELSITATVMDSYAIYTVVGAILFLGETPTSAQLGLIAINILGVIIISLPNKVNKDDILNYKYIVWPLIGAVTIGLSDTLSKGAIDSLDIGTYLTGLAWAHLPISLIAIYATKEYKQFSFKITEYKNALIGSLFSSIGTLFLFTSFNYGDASILAPITATAPVPTIILSIVLLKERLSTKDIFGILLVLIGIIGISTV